MKKGIALILIFFLAFSLNFQLAKGLSTNQCRHYVDGVCQTQDMYPQSPEETTQNVYVPETTQETTTAEPPKFVIAIFQLIGIAVLFALLMMLIQEMRKSGQKTKRRR